MANMRICYWDWINSKGWMNNYGEVMPPPIRFLRNRGIENCRTFYENSRRKKILGPRYQFSSKVCSLSLKGERDGVWFLRSRQSTLIGEKQKAIQIILYFASGPIMMKVVYISIEKMEPKLNALKVSIYVSQTPLQ